MTVKETSEKVTFASGMQRGVDPAKINFLLTRDGPMLKRWAQHISTGASIYGVRNWMLANGYEELDRFKESAARHFEQWLNGEIDEDHAAATYFNINGVEYVTERFRR